MKNSRKILSIIFMLISIGAVCVLYLCWNSSVAPVSLGTVRVNVETYLAGKNQPTHPSVIVFPGRWNGAKYWLAYSPYPYANGEEENPCLAISDDLLYWQCPAGLANPIANNEETGCDELKDPHLVYRDDLDRLEMWYLGRLSENLGGDGKSLLLMRKYSYDGSSWSDYEVMSSTKYLSPSIVWDGEKYRMWAIGYDLWNTTGTIAYQESPDGMNWTEPVNCSLGDKQRNIDIWHGSVMEYKGVYYMSYIDNTDQQEIFYCTSRDGINFDEPKMIVSNDGFWRNLYRPFLWVDSEGYNCIYGVVNGANQWYLSMSTGVDESHLVGIREAQTDAMQSIPDDVIDTHSPRYHIKTIYDAIQKHLRLELLMLAVLEVGLLVLVKSLRKNKHMNALFTCVNFLISLAYIFVRLCPIAYMQKLGAFVAACVLNMGMSAVISCTNTLLCSKEKNDEE